LENQARNEEKNGNSGKDYLLDEYNIESLRQWRERK
jgi:hypothetical protein